MKLRTNLIEPRVVNLICLVFSPGGIDVFPVGWEVDVS